MILNKNKKRYNEITPVNERKFENGLVSKIHMSWVTFSLIALAWIKEDIDWAD